VVVAFLRKFCPSMFMGELRPFQPATSHIWRSANHSTTTLGGRTHSSASGLGAPQNKTAASSSIQNKNSSTPQEQQSNVHWRCTHDEKPINDLITF
jgi:hypothetical protein